MRFIFIISLNILFSQVFLTQKPNGLKLHFDTLLFSKIPVKLNAQSDAQLNPRNAVLYRDSLKYKRVYFRNDFPIKRHQKNPVPMDSSEVDTLYIKGYIGSIEIEELSHNFTFFNPMNDLHKEDFWEVPKSAIYYQNPNKVQVDLNQFQLSTTEVSSRNPSSYFKPFYFQNTEITNLWYRAFVEYVRDSIARRTLGDELDPNVWLIPTYDSLGYEKDTDDWHINWEPELDFSKYIDNEQFPYLASMYLGVSDRFYGHMEIDTRKLMYKYVDNEGYKYIINVYPDTLCWIKNFSGRWAEPKTNMYFWHPYYDDFPVVGISYQQAKAFCHWMTQEINKYLNKNNRPYKITYRLPSIVEWDYVRQQVMLENGCIVEPRFNWETNLVLEENQTLPLNDQIDSTYSYEVFKNNEGKLLRNNVLITPPSTEVEFMPRSVIFESVPFMFLSSNSKVSKKKIKQSIHNVKNMGTSVSEWLLEDYQNNWSLMYYKRMELLIKTAGADTDIQAMREEYFNTFNDKIGQLVIGANWYDFRDDYYEGKSFETMDAKVFVNPDKGFSTVGFRMVATIDFPNED